MNEMRVGDIGVLQNFITAPYRNGMIAEIRLVYGLHENHRGLFEYGYVCHIFGQTTNPAGDIIGKHQIRPITDPDATIKQEQECEA